MASTIGLPDASIFTSMIIRAGADEPGRGPGLAVGGPTVGGKVKVDWKRVSAAGSVIGGIAVMHGLKTRPASQGAKDH